MAATRKRKRVSLNIPNSLTYHRRRQRRGASATVGKITPPDVIDIRSHEDIPKMIQALQEGSKNGNKKKWVVLVVYYADWCGHCHRFLPEYKEAATMPGRFVPMISVKDDMIQSVNEAIRSKVNSSAPPVKIDGFPTVLAMDQNGEVLTPPGSSKEILARDATGMKTVIQDTQEAVNRANGNIQNTPSMEDLPDEPLPTSDVMRDHTDSSEESEESEEGSIREQAEKALQKPLSPILNEPSSTFSHRGGAPHKVYTQGGGLFHALSQTARVLAPTAALMGTASYVLKKSKKGKKSKRGKKSKKRYTSRR